MRATGVAWLPHVPNSWKIAGAGVIFRESKSIAPDDLSVLTPSKEYGVVTREEYSRLSGHRPNENIATTHLMRHVIPGDFIITMGSFESGIEYSKIEGKITPHYRVLRPTIQVHDGYYKWLFKSKPLIDGLASIATEIRKGQEINYNKFSRLTIPLPDYPTQCRIADYLDRETAQIDAMTEALDQLVARLEERRRSVVSNLIRIAEDFDDLRQSTRLGLVSEIIRRGISPTYADEGLPVVNQKCVRQNGVFEPKSRRNHSESKRQVPQELILQEGDALVNSTGTGTLGRSCIVRGISEHTTWDSHVTVVRPRKQLLLPSFLNFVLLDNENRFVELSQGSTNQIELSRDVVFNLPIPLPPLDEQRRIADHLDGETAKIDAMIAKAGELRALLDERRNALITASVTGQHPVPEEP
ncbi:restriction endonuclease subunit S [Corynebacterium freneyi]|uniref:restriction endonuclease subunit S n=1 Tax=Corynebacterium freneyi TaxID=134034 RepID=UPI00396CF852